MMIVYDTKVRVFKMVKNQTLICSITKNADRVKPPVELPVCVEITKNLRLSVLAVQTFYQK
jgi:hypothetical protein